MKINKIKIIAISLILAAVCSPLHAVDISWKIYNIVNNKLHKSGIQFGTILPTDTFKLANQYIIMGFELNPDVKEWTVGLEGNLKNTTYPELDFTIPLAWKVVSSIPVEISVANPDAGSGWYWMDNGHVIMRGTEKYAELDDGTQCNSPIRIYIEGLFDKVVAGDYSGTIDYVFTDYTDSGMPVIIHVPIAKIGMIGNRVLIEAIITDDRQVVSADLHFKLDDGKWAIREMTISKDSITELQAEPQELSVLRYAYARIEPAELIGVEKMYYCIETTDGYNPMFWKSRENPQMVRISQTSEFSAVKDGLLEVADGNPEDGETSLDIGKGALDDKVNIIIRQRNLDDISVPDGSGATTSRRPVAVYEFEPSGLRFKKPVLLTILYLDLDHDGEVELMDGELAGISEEDLGLFWWDGFEWRLLSKKVDKENNTISAKVTHFSMFAVFPVSPLSADDYRPRRNIITPATLDTYNDFANFDALTDEYKIDIYDISGRLVKTIDENSASGTTWDGTDKYGEIVESGVYIYQFRAEVYNKMELISGTIVIAK